MGVPAARTSSPRVTGRPSKRVSPRIIPAVPNHQKSGKSARRACQWSGVHPFLGRRADKEGFRRDRSPAPRRRFVSDHPRLVRVRRDRRQGNRPVGGCQLREEAEAVAPEPSGTRPRRPAVGAETGCANSFW
jgi:hypothetical protein